MGHTKQARRGIGIIIGNSEMKSIHHGREEPFINASANGIKWHCDTYQPAQLCGNVLPFRSLTWMINLMSYSLAVEKRMNR